MTNPNSITAAATTVSDAEKWARKTWRAMQAKPTPCPECAGGGCDACDRTGDQLCTCCEEEASTVGELCARCEANSNHCAKCDEVCGADDVLCADCEPPEDDHDLACDSARDEARGA